MKQMTPAQKENIRYMLAGLCFLLPGIVMGRFIIEEHLRDLYRYAAFPRAFPSLYAILPVIVCILLALGSFFKNLFPLAAAGYAALGGLQLGTLVNAAAGRMGYAFGLPEALELAACVWAIGLIFGRRRRTGIMGIAARQQGREKDMRWAKGLWCAPAVLFALEALAEGIAEASRLTLHGYAFSWAVYLSRWGFRLLPVTFPLMLGIGSLLLLWPPAGQDTPAEQ